MQEIQLLKRQISNMTEILVCLDYCCCEYCDMWIQTNDLYETVDHDVICENCMIDNSFLPCHSCGKLDHVENMECNCDDNNNWDFCKNCLQ